MSASATARISEPRAKGIVASVRRHERSSAALQSRSASARQYSDAVLRSRILMSEGPKQVRNRQIADYSPPSIMASAQAMCPSKPSDSAIAR